MIWKFLLRPVLGPFSGPVEGHLAVKKANQHFAPISQFIAGLNQTILEYVPPGLASSVGISLTAWSREGEHIVSSLRLRSLRKQEVMIPIQIKLGTEQLKIGETSLLLSDNERILSIITRTVSDFFST
jgi:hypothetical protein